MKKNRLTSGKASGFKLPEGYFGQFENRMIRRIAAEEASFLPKNSQPFGVPEGYFEEFESRMLEKVKVGPKQPKVIPLFSKRNLSYVSGIAAVLAVLLTSSLLDKPAGNSYEDLNLAAVENYIFETFEMSEATETPFVLEEEVNWNEDAEIDKDALLEYLSENVEEPAILFNAP